MVDTPIGRLMRFFLSVTCALVPASVFAQDSGRDAFSTEAPLTRFPGGMMTASEAFPTHSGVVGRMLAGDATFTKLIGYANGVGGVAQSSVPAAIFRSTSCGFQTRISGTPSYLHQMIFFNIKKLSPLRSYSIPVCFDTCHRGNRCPTQNGPQDCDCLDADELPIAAHFQLYEGDPCGDGIAISGTQATIAITADDIPPETIGDGTSKCFELTAVVDPKVEVPEEVWLEANFGHDDSWPIFGQPDFRTNRGDNELGGLDDGVECTTFCFRGGPNCSSDPDFCDWIIPSVDANADVVFSLQPVPPPAETKHAETFTYRIEGNQAILARGGEPVFFEVRVSDFDPNGEGIRIKVWRVGIESAGYTSGLRGTVTPAVLPCPGGQADCDALVGGASICGLGVNVPDDECPPAFVDQSRTDYLFFGLTGGFCNVIMRDYRCIGTLGDRSIESPGTDSYLLSLVVDASPNAAGTFTIDLTLPPVTTLRDPDNHFLPLIGVVGGKVTIETGRCCVDFGDACVDTLTLNECDAEGGVLAPNLTCAENPCPTFGACCDALVVDGACTDNIAQADCFGAHLTWSLRTACSAVVCDEATGACCVDGPCTDAVARSQCDTDNWYNGLTCDDPVVSEPCTDKGRIPTVSAWGVAVMTLLFLVGAKVYFGRREVVKE